jgi:hypothetical protein
MDSVFRVPYTHSTALRMREIITASLHRTISRSYQDWFWSEIDQLEIDLRVDQLWQLWGAWGLTPHSCRDSSCHCHVVIDEGAPDHASAHRM